jgi:ATP-dependent DNA helicase RecQ
MSILDMTEILNTLPRSRWTDMIGEGIGLLARDVAEREIPVPEIVEWFGEWSRDVKGEQRGLLLLTAHRAKGLEFDHVAILDGGWDRTSREEDPDAPRRLFYVAMTRARKSLLILGSGKHALLDPEASEAILSRRAHVSAVNFPGMARRYIATDLSLVDLSFAGRAGPQQAIHGAIRAAKVGDPVKLVQSKLGWVVTDVKGAILTRMSKAFAPPKGMQVVSAKVGAVITWRKEDGAEEYRDRIRVDEWEVVLPDLVFAPKGH